MGLNYGSIFCDFCFFVLITSSVYTWLYGSVADGDDETQCCASNGVTGECLGICSGNIINFPTDILDCKSHVDTYYSCYNVYQSSTPVAPTVPGNVYLKSTAFICLVPLNTVTFAVIGYVELCFCCAVESCTYGVVQKTKPLSYCHRFI